MTRFLPAKIAGKKFVWLREIRGYKNFKYLWLDIKHFSKF